MSVFFVFIWYFIGADLPKNVAKCAGFQKGIKKGSMTIWRGICLQKEVLNLLDTMTMFYVYNKSYD